MICNNCKKLIDDNSVFCKYCGQSTSTPSFDSISFNTSYENSYNKVEQEPKGKVNAKEYSFSNKANNNDAQQSSPLNNQVQQNTAQNSVQNGIYCTQYVEPSFDGEIPMTQIDKGLRIAAFVLSLLSTIGWGILLIPLCWQIPMTVHAWRVYKGVRPNKTSFGVCTIIFLNLVSGILLLSSKKDA